MTPPLPAALRVATEGLYALEAAIDLIIAHGTWLARDDFAASSTTHRGRINRLGSRHHRPGRRRTPELRRGKADATTGSKSRR
jgi:hypothetical protein